MHNDYTCFNSLCTGNFSTGSDRNIALLDDVFRKFPHIAVNIEVKENNSMLIEKAREQSSYSICTKKPEPQNRSLYFLTIFNYIKTSLFVILFDTVFIQISDLVKKHDREAISVWASADSTIMKMCHKTVRMHSCFKNKSPTYFPLSYLFSSVSFCQWQNSSMPYMFTIKRCLKMLLLYYTGLLPFVPLGESFLQFYLPQIINRSVYTKYFHSAW